MYSASDWFILIAFPLSDSPCNRMKVTPFKQNLLFRNLLLLSAKSLVTLTYLSSSQNFPRVSDLNERMNPLLPVPFKLREFGSLWQKAYTWKVSPLWWLIYIINSVDKTKLSCNTLHWRSITVSAETYPTKSWKVINHPGHTKN